MYGKALRRASILSGVCLILQVLTWIPQNDVLGHPSVRAFLSHCGANSMYEVWQLAVLRMSCQLVSPSTGSD